jgi:DNA repair exonuclease SbcCD ATPase subunit
MKTTLIKIKNILGITELQLNGASVEITGTNGTGKSSVIEAIRYALTNSIKRDVLIRRGETEGEILIETDTGLHINRKARTDMSDYKQIRQDGKDVGSPESFLREIFTPMQIDPVEFTRMTKAEQNKIILGLIDFPWNLAWIQQQFGEVPKGVDYSQHILQVLNDIQAEKGEYFQTRQELNRDIRTKRGVAETIAKDIPAGYQAEKWEAFDLGAKYSVLNGMKEENAKIERAKEYRASIDGKIRAFEAERDIAINSQVKAIATEREGLKLSIERMKAEIKAAEDKLAGLDSKLADKTKLEQAEFEKKVAELKQNADVADKWAEKQKHDVAPLQDEITEAEAMKRHLNEYARMKAVLRDVDELTEDSEELTRKIELARNLPAEILKTATIPVEGLTVENGIPLIKGLPITNLSEGEQLDLCVDVTLSKPGSLQIILIDGAEKLSDTNRERLYAKCKAKGLQFVATRTTNQDELAVTQL